MIMIMFMIRTGTGMMGMELVGGDRSIGFWAIGLAGW